MSNLMFETDSLVVVGKILKPFGVKGEVRVQSLSDVPGRLEGLKAVTLVSPSGKAVHTEVEQVRSDGRSYVLKFSAFSSPEEVQDVQGAWVKIPQEAVPPLPDGQHYQFELIGLEVRNEEGERLGILEEILDLPSHPIFVVRNGEEEFLIPATQQVVKNVDAKLGLVTVRLPKKES